MPSASQSVQVDKGARYYHVFLSCIVIKLYIIKGETQSVTYFKVLPHRKHKGTREIHEIIQYTPHKVSQSNAIDFTR